MHTSIMLVALTGLMAPLEGAASPTWLRDYSQARRQGAAQKKPLAVFLSSGKESWGRRVTEGSVGAEVRRLLASHYVCVSLDTTTEEGRRLASAFEMPNGLGLVISDRSGSLQAFSHPGELSGAELARYLERYAAEDRVAATTETHTTGRTSFYPAPPPTSSFTPPAFQGWTQPNYGYFPSFGGASGGCST